MFRYLWKSRLFTLLNIVGLAVGISACWVIYGIVSYEFGFDRKITDKEQVYRVVSRFKFEGQESGNGGVPVPLVTAIKEQLPGVAEVIPVWNQWKSVAGVSTTTGGTVRRFDPPEDQISTTTAYFNLVPYRWLAGSAAQALSAPYQVVLTRSRAEKYFPGVEPAAVLGKTVLYNDTIPVKVAGVVADLSFASSFPWSEIFALQPQALAGGNWDGVSSQNTIYLKLKPETDVAKLTKTISEMSVAEIKADMEKYHYERWHQLIPMKEVHFSSGYGENVVHKANKKVLWGLMGIAGFLLVLACINYINLTTAQVPQRSREIGIRRTLGSGRWQLIRPFLLETLAITLLAVAVSFFLARIATGAFSNIMPQGMRLYTSYWSIGVFLLLLIVVVTLLAGIYPGWLITRVEAVNMMRGKDAGQTGRKGLILRKSLIVFQFTVAQLFILGAVIVGKQLHYLLHADMGFNRDAVVLASVPWQIINNEKYKDRHFVAQQEIKQLSGVEGVTMGQAPVNTSFNSTMYQYIDAAGKKTDIQIYLKFADSATIGLYRIPLLAGRNLEPCDTLKEVVLNETAAKAFGFTTPAAAVGQYILAEENKRVPIVGVVKDFHIAGLQTKIEPAALIMRKNMLTCFNIRLSGKPEQWQQELAKIQAIWKKHYPETPFNYKFYDDSLRDIYDSEVTTGKIVNVATAVCIIVSCLGLFGLSTLTAWQRVKEIGIRKVLGASTTEIVRVLSVDFLKLVLVAAIIAVPAAAYYMQGWLKDFAYHINMAWWVFLSAGLLAAIIALATISFQAIKAALANPVKSLRTE